MGQGRSHATAGKELLASTSKAGFDKGCWWLEKLICMIRASRPPGALQKASHHQGGSVQAFLPSCNGLLDLTTC